MANITRIKASDTTKKSDEAKSKPKNPDDAGVKQAEKVTAEATKSETSKLAANKSATGKLVASKSATGKKPFILIRPFVAFGRYLCDAWKEIRQVRWPNRKATWKMVLAVFFYTALFVILISLLDLLFTWLFSLILGNK